MPKSTPFAEINNQVLDFTGKMDKFARKIDRQVVDMVLENQLQYLEYSVSAFALRIRAMMAFYQFLELHGIGATKSDERVSAFNNHLPSLIMHIECSMQRQGGADMSVVIVKYLLQRVIHQKKEDIAEILFRDILSHSHWKEHAGLISPLINCSTAINKLLVQYILPLEHWDPAVHDSWLRSVVAGGSVDRDFSKYVLGRPPHNKREDLKQLMIKRHVDPARSIGAHIDLEKGITVPTVQNKIKIKGLAGKGNTGAVYKGVLQDGTQVSLKVCIKYEPEQILSMKRENKKMKQLAELEITHPDIIEEGDDFLVKEWVEGVTGSEWFQSWSVKADVSEESFVKLKQLFDHVASTSVYLQNFKPANLLWDGSNWQVIDYGGTKTIGMNPEKVRQRLYDKFDKMWNKSKGAVPPMSTLVESMKLSAEKST